MFSSIETPIQQAPPTNPTETAESTLPSEESITTPMLNNLQGFTNEIALLKEQIQKLATKIEVVKMLMKEKLFLLEKAQKDKNDEEKHSSENSERVKLLRQQNILYLRKMRLKTK